MTKLGKEFNQKYNLDISDASFKEVKFSEVDSSISLMKPTKNWIQVLKRFLKNPWAMISLFVFLIIVILSIVFGQTSDYNPDETISLKPDNSIGRIGSQLSDVKSLKGSSHIISEWVDDDKLDMINKAINEAKGTEYAFSINTNGGEAINGRHHIIWNPFDLLNFQDKVHHNSVIGTDSLGRDIWTRLWYGTTKSLLLAIVVVTITTIIGTLLGSWIGLYVGTIVDIIFMKILSIYLSVPSIIWYSIILFILPPGIFSLGIVFVITGWTRGLAISRMYMWKYVNSDFIKAAKVSGVSKLGLIVKHALPNYIGIIAIGFVESIPGIITSEASLSFIGLSPNPSGASLGNVLNEAQEAIKGLDHAIYLLLPTFVIMIISLSLKFVAIGINDAFEPKFAGGRK